MGLFFNESKAMEEIKALKNIVAEQNSEILGMKNQIEKQKDIGDFSLISTKYPLGYVVLESRKRGNYSFYTNPALSLVYYRFSDFDKEIKKLCLEEDIYSDINTDRCFGVDIAKTIIKKENGCTKIVVDVKKSIYKTDQKLVYHVSEQENKAIKIR